MIKQYLSSPTISYVIGFLGVGISMSGLNPILRIVIAVISILILVFTAGIKLEEYLKKRHKRMMREETRGMSAFLKFLKANADQTKLDQEAVEELDKAHDDFVEDTNL